MHKGPEKKVEGTTLRYDRAFLIKLRNSPLSQGFPVGAETIPGVIEPPSDHKKKKCTPK